MKFPQKYIDALRDTNLYKLSTKEDPMHIHKFLGFFSLLHFTYRYYLLFVYGSMFIQNQFDLGIIAMHGCLSLSSIMFRIPQKRHANLPLIYPEFRLHSIAFGLRSIICCFVDFYGGTYKLYYKICVCFGTMLVADLITKYNAEPEDTTMRAMPYSEHISKKDINNITTFHSNQQATATIFMICNMDSAFSPLFAIQFAAFLMTMVRKSIIGPNNWHLLYSLSLMINVFVCYTFNLSQLLNVFIGIHCFRLLRMKLRMNKYLGWMLTFGIFSILDLRYINSYTYAQNIIHYVMTIYIIKNIYITRNLYSLQRN
jgi:hypothetical protein